MEWENRHSRYACTEIYISISVSKGCCPNYQIFAIIMKEICIKSLTLITKSTIFFFEMMFLISFLGFESRNITKARNHSFYDISSTKSGERLLRPGLFMTRLRLCTPACASPRVNVNASCSLVLTHLCNTFHAPSAFSLTIFWFTYK